MRWVKSNGERLEVREVGDVAFVLEPSGRVPLPILLDVVLPDDEARGLLRGLLDTGNYKRVK